MAINSTLSFELQPEEEHEDEEGAEESGGEEEEGMHLLYSTRPLERGSVGGCGVSHTPVPPIHIPPQVPHRVRGAGSTIKCLFILELELLMFSPLLEIPY